MRLGLDSCIALEVRIAPTNLMWLGLDSYIALQVKIGPTNCSCIKSSNLLWQFLDYWTIFKEWFCLHVKWICPCKYQFMPWSILLSKFNACNVQQFNFILFFDVISNVINGGFNFHPHVTIVSNRFLHLWIWIRVSLSIWTRY